MQNLALFVDRSTVCYTLIISRTEVRLRIIDYHSIAANYCDRPYQSEVNVPFYEVVDSQSDNGVTRQLAINYALRTTNMYYRFANGSKSGGYNGEFLSSEEQAILANYGKERLNAHEVGLKSWWPKQNLRMNWAGFY